MTGPAPVQGFGRIDSLLCWYFRAGDRHWTLAVGQEDKEFPG